jgi:hypothetical protein
VLKTTPKWALTTPKCTANNPASSAGPAIQPTPKCTAKKEEDPTNKEDPEEEQLFMSEDDAEDDAADRMPRG